MSTLSQTAVVARLTWVRLRRSRTLWIVVALALIPVLAGLLRLLDSAPGLVRFQTTAQVGIRLYVLLAAATALSSAVAEELEGHTITYLFSRPMPRYTLLLGKLAATVPLLVGLGAVTFTAAFFLTMGGAAGQNLPLLGKTILAVALGTISASTFCVGIGALFPKHPFIVCVGYLLAVDNLLSFVPNVANVSMVSHTLVVAGLPAQGLEADPSRSVAALLVLAALWLAVGVWRVSVAEYGKADT